MSEPATTAVGADAGPREEAPARQLSPREIRRQQRLRIGREQILDAAEELFGRQGYRGTSLQQVAKRCEFSIGALYLFIDSKEELLRAVLDRRHSDLMAQMRACLATGGTGHDALLRLARLQVDFHRRHPDFGRLSVQIVSAAGTDPGSVEATSGFKEDVARGYEAAIELEAEFFALGQQDGTLRAGDPICLARLFSSLVFSYHAMDPGVVTSGPTLSDDIFLSTVSQAFSPPPWPAPAS
ncbi:MAG: TetR/AcrR family transcriptional regulator [Frankia sp.]|nr:TetR/AcrR family transcriptional regulator [Frankia sp.]